MPPLLSPLPGHVLDLNPRVVERSVLCMLPIWSGQELPAQVTATLPPWPNFKAALVSASSTEVPSETSILPSEPISSLGIYPLPQDLVMNRLTQQLPMPQAAATQVSAPEPDPEFVPDRPPQAAFTDHDLFQALEPLAGKILRHTLHDENGGGDAYLNPLLRSTIRSALAGDAIPSRYSKRPKASRRLLWRMQALLSRRDYQDILFKKTRRYQVEEVLLLNAETLSLISFASSDPARHRSEKMVSTTCEQIASQLRAAGGAIHNSFSVNDQLVAISCMSPKLVLTALVRGEPNDTI